MYYLTYRPQRIDEIDNEKIREKLTNLFKTTSIPHAFLFTGEKGVGKTSTARIIAKIINCEKNKFSGNSNDIEPCNTCEQCISITQGSAIDVIEMDAASNRKIDEIRSLIDTIKFAPAYSRYKVYIIDEVHMLTTEAFNALLKTLEEPPASTIFILATTELDKLPKTIISRCIHFNFGRGEVKEIVNMLKRIIKHEKLRIDDKTLEFIAQRGDHSFRDSTKILEETVISGKLTMEGVKSVLGLTGSSWELLQLIEEKKVKECISYLQTYEENGSSFITLVETLLDRLHQILLAKTGLVTSLDREYNFTLSEITFLIKALQEALQTTKISPIESLPTEVALIEYFQIKK